MERVYSSIFNDVLGPVMNGPSSSHSAGCARIGFMTRCLYGKDITQADVVFEELGSALLVVLLEFLLRIQD